MSQRELKLNIEDRISDIINILSKGKDAEIRLVKNGIAVSEVSRKRIERKENS